MDEKEVSRWSFQDLLAGPGYAATLAVERSFSRMVLWDLEYAWHAHLARGSLHAQAGQPALHYEVSLNADFLFALPRTRSFCRSYLRPCRGCWLASPDAPTIDQSFGVNIHFTTRSRARIKMIADAGFRWVRMDLKWDATESARGRYDFAAYDRLMTAIESFGLRAYVHSRLWKSSLW
jgi:hypothetical protein